MSTSGRVSVVSAASSVSRGARSGAGVASALALAAAAVAAAGAVALSRVSASMSNCCDMAPYTSMGFTTTPAGALTGTLAVNTDPTPRRLSRLMLPPSEVTICFTRARPTPEPMLFCLLSVW